MQEPPKFGKHQPGTLDGVAIGVAAELVSPCTRLSFAPAVLLPCATRVVICVAVELDGDSKVGPPAVHAATARGAIGLGQDETVFSQQLQNRRSSSLSATRSSPRRTRASALRDCSVAVRGSAPPASACREGHRLRGTPARAHRFRARLRGQRWFARRLSRECCERTWLPTLRACELAAFGRR